ncbi:unnamed protein product [Orchesella dallaii]|uniref:Uncharacterized protein n=1 Tax=Orchesella dallaii TaxID=48710 RepID=A0ABP1QE57_9HEXA
MEKYLVNKFQLTIYQDFGLAGYAFSAAMFESKANFELIRDAEMYTKVVDTTIGPVSLLVKKAGIAFNEIIGDTNVTNRKHILYLDTIAMYLECMRQPLPYDSFRLLCPSEVDTFDVNIKTEFDYLINASWAYTADKEYSKDFPFIVEKLPITIVNGEQVIGQSGVNNTVYRVVQTQLDKNNVSLFQDSCLFFLQKGMSITKINWIIEYRSKSWLKSYMDKCMDMRETARYPFQKGLAKKLANFVFGKLMAQSNTKTIRFCKSALQAERLTRKDNITSIEILTPELSMYKLASRTVLASKNPLVAAFILDYSKTMLFRHIYKMKDLFGPRFLLCAVETDSLIIELTDDANSFVTEMKLLGPMFQWDSISSSHPLFAKEARQKPGALKFELSYIKEFIKLASKSFCLLTKCANCRQATLDSIYGEMCNKCGSKTTLLRGVGKNSQATFESYRKALRNEQENLAGCSYSITRDMGDVKLVQKKESSLKHNNGYRIFPVGSLMSYPIGYDAIPNDGGLEG